MECSDQPNNSIVSSVRSISQESLNTQLIQTHVGNTRTVYPENRIDKNVIFISIQFQKAKRQVEALQETKNIHAFYLSTFQYSASHRYLRHY